MSGAVYKVKYVKQVYKLALLGCTDTQLADIFEIATCTLSHWKKHKPDFMKSLKRGRAVADSNVAKALYQRAIGYTHPEVHIMPNRVKEYGKDSVTGKPYLISERNEPLIIPITKIYPPDSFACLKWLALRQKEYWSETHTVQHNHTVAGKIDVNHLQNQLSDMTEYSVEDLKMALQLGIKEQIEAGNVTSN